MPEPRATPSAGVIRQILLAPYKGAPMVDVGQVEAVAGCGLVGDHHFSRSGQTSLGIDNHVTLIESEKIAEFVDSAGVLFAAEDARRNLVTEGIDLNALLDREFRVGPVTVKALELCEPCAGLAKRTHRAVLWGLVHRAGLRCRITSTGTIRVGDPVA